MIILLLNLKIVIQNSWNSKLIYILHLSMSIDKFEKLVQYITEEPDDENDKLRSFKYFFII